jgi:tetratricopeptide (TPR) repeat protein
MPSRRVCRTFALGTLLVLSRLLVSCRGSTSSNDDWDRHVKNVQEHGAPLVRAIYKYHAACGLWPYSLDELVPDYAGPQRIRGWDYTWRPGGWWYLTDYGAFPKELLRYDHVSDAKAAWMATDGDDDAWLDGDEVEPPKAEVPEKERDAARIIVLRSRIARYKNEIIHHEGLIYWYYTHGDYDNAREACEKCLKRWPSHWWPNLMMAYIEYKLGRIEDADERLERFTTEHDDLTHWYLAAVFHLEAGQPGKARKELARAAEVPLADLAGKGSSDDGEVLGYSTGYGIAWRAATLCCHQRWFEEGLAIADQWECCEKKNPYGFHQYRAFQAASYLTLGNVDKAREPLRQVMEESKTRNIGLKNLDELEKAIERKDYAYRYDPGDNPPPFSVLVDYK